MGIYSVTDFASVLADSKDTNNIWQASVDFFAQYGLDGLVYINKKDKTFAIKTTLPEYWQDHYLDSNYDKIDPFFSTCCVNFAPIKTGADYIKDIPTLSNEQIKLINEVGETGFTAGFSSPFKLLSATGAGGWSLMSSYGKKAVDAAFEVHGELLQMASFCAHQALENADEQHAGQLPLTPRETECLQWIATGLRTQQVAYKMRLKPVTISFHLNNIHKKLSTSTREHALAKAIYFGYISL